LRSVSIRVVSLAITLATSLSFLPGTDTMIEVGLLAKLNALEMM